MEETHLIHIRISKQLLDELDEFGKTTEYPVSRSDVIRRAVRVFLDMRKAEARAEI
jgi:metal-responsive CopG/Arc/MetJ family transcriptional regulator